MTKEQATEKAKQLWGEAAIVTFDQHNFFVGEKNGPIITYYGSGDSWEDAFEQARFTLN